jgi:hypothetical protein
MRTTKNSQWKLLLETNGAVIEAMSRYDINCCHVKITGILTGFELLNDVCKEIQKYVDRSILENLQHRIIDLSECLLHTSYSDMNNLAHKKKKAYEVNPKSKVAIVAAHNVTYGYMRVYVMKVIMVNEIFSNDFLKLKNGCQN